MYKPDDIEKLVRTMFADTVTARMLRIMQGREVWSQHEFMRVYHVRAERPNGGRSSLGNNFGRFLVRNARNTASHKEARSSMPRVIRQVRRPRKLHGYSNHDVMTGERIDDQAREWDLLVETSPRANVALRDIKRGSCALVWTGPSRETLLASMTPSTLAWAFESMERQITVTRATDNQFAEITPSEWCVMLRAALSTPVHATVNAESHNPVREYRDRYVTEFMRAARR